MKFAVSRLAALSALAFLTACGSVGIETKKVEYKSAAKAPTLETPPDLIAPARDDRFAVPDVGGKGKATFSAYANERTAEGRAARGSDVLPQVDKVRIERSGNQRWLVVGGSPDKHWDVVKEFWQETGFLIKLELPEAGVMETDWAENRAKIPQDFIRNFLGKVIDSVYSTAERDKFRTRLEPGAEPGTTDIFISHRGMYEIFVSEGKDQTKWQPRPADPELEAEMLRRLMVRFGSEEKRAAAEIVAAQERPAAERAKIVRGSDGAGVLEVQERFDRAWRRVGLALDRVGFTVEDRDRSKGLYFVRYVDPEADVNSKKDGESWLAKLNPFKGSEAATLSKMQYRIYVADGSSVSKVQVLSREGGADNSETARKILGLLHEQLR
ncbi:outer membrane protein assembly factor BamC [Azospira restricta]|uniref:Outer membrane protein assembly factor BamC n=1 Tax=Azospira restricta TaxID=404405 RepID=A0A974PVN1_9RHOO|nr:outer membrane protein assembly factor BamC [Azospira restricta]QRJ62176.1 outer membrane protein assembly factor BamC [Azospira restricta]